MHKLLTFNLLFHLNLIFFFCFVLGTVFTFYLRFSIGISFMLGKFPGNESFRITLESPFSIYWMFNISVIVTKRLLKALATFIGSFNFPSFTSKVEICSTECTFPIYFFIIFHVTTEPKYATDIWTWTWRSLVHCR